MLTLLAALSLCAAIWFGLLWTNEPMLVDVRVRLGLMAAVMATVGVFTLIAFVRRRRAARALERSLIEGPGDGAVLADRMKDALTKLKKRGGATYLYDLPWYVIIGPPGAGKTTALVHSGLSFPGTDQAAISGFGGTRNCDFWFAENAVLIDTAGRYTTQDSDARADQNSWLAFLNQLKRARPNQPVNGVMLAFSCEDMAHWTDDRLALHAEAVRQRLAELNDKLRVDVPVYVIFTKADKIAGFREFFASFDETRRRKVWGATFQTKRKKDQTVQHVSGEFDALLSRLSAEVTDRLNEEPDPAARIAIFGFPGQMAMLQAKAADFLRRIFENPRGTSAYLRGFYFTSGTQEGTPIDQVLGAMAQGTFGMGPNSGFLSGRGKSFFLHDLLNDVIFPEQNWVGFDKASMRLRGFLRGTAKILITTTSVFAIAILGYSFWQNATLVRKTAADTQRYEEMNARQPALSDPVITDPNPAPVLDALDILRDLPAGYAAPSEETVFETVGLSRRDSLRQAARKAYSDGLERHLRPRMMLHFENTLPQLLADENLTDAYRALKVYILLAKQQPGKDQDDAIKRYFSEVWNTQLRDADYATALDHLTAMLDLDDRVTPLIPASADIIEPVQQKLATLTQAERIYNAILRDQTGLPRFEFKDALSRSQAKQVFRTKSGVQLDQLDVAGVFTFDGFWTGVLPSLDRAVAMLADDTWLLGSWQTPPSETYQQYGLSRDILTLYRRAFAAAWNDALDQIELQPHASDTKILGLLASEATTPLLPLAQAVFQETRLSRDPALAVPGSEQERIAKLVEQAFYPWHRMVMPDGDGRTSVVALSRQYNTLLTVLTSAVQQPDPQKDAIRLNAALTALMQSRPQYPRSVQGMIAQTERAFSGYSAGPRLQDMETALEYVTAFCTQSIAGHYPFDPDGPDLSLSVFQEFFGPGGWMETYFNSYLKTYVVTETGRQSIPDRDHPIGKLISSKVVEQFSQANEIRAAFFPNRSAVPVVGFDMVIGPSDPAVQITVGDRTIGANTGSTRVTWPDEVAGSLLMDRDGAAPLRFDGPWAPVRFLRNGRIDQQDTRTVLTTQSSGAGSVQVELSFDTDPAPFLLPALSAFTCPRKVQ